MESGKQEKFNEAKAEYHEKKYQSTFKPERDMRIWFDKWRRLYPSIETDLFIFWEGILEGIDTERRHSTVVAKSPTTSFSKYSASWLLPTLVIGLVAAFLTLPLRYSVCIALFLPLLLIVHFWIKNWLRNVIVASGLSLLSWGALGGGATIKGNAAGQEFLFEAIFGSPAQSITAMILGGIILCAAALVWGRKPNS